MDRYICLNCEYVYEEEKGTPNYRIPPNMNALRKSGCGWHKGLDGAPDVIAVPAGTKWPDVPPDFTCPSCGSGKDMFEMD